MFEPIPSTGRSRPPRTGAGLAAALTLLLLAWLLGRAGGMTGPSFGFDDEKNPAPEQSSPNTPVPGAEPDSDAGTGGSTDPNSGAERDPDPRRDLDPDHPPGRDAAATQDPPDAFAGEVGMPPPGPPSSKRAPEARYALAAEQHIADYVVQHWKREDEGMHFDDVLRFFPVSDADAERAAAEQAGESDSAGSEARQAGRSAIEVRGGVEIHQRSGEDLDGDGLPDLVIQRYTGGAHCCFSTHVYTLAPAPQPARLLMRSPDSNCPGDFEDLDGDGLPEFLTCDDLMAYVRCPYAISPMPKVYLRAEPGLGYLPASARFAERYAEGIQAKMRALQARMADAPGTGDASEALDAGAEACEVLDVTLDMLYAGRAAEGWRFLDENYRGADVGELRAEVEAALAASPYYLPRGEAPRPVKAKE